MGEQSFMEQAAELYSKRQAALHAVARAQKTKKPGSTGLYFAASEAMGVATDAVRRAWCLLDRIELIANDHTKAATEDLP